MNARQIVIDRDVESIVARLRAKPKEVQRLSGKRVLVIGGNGFLGSYLVYALHALGTTLPTPCEVMSIDISERRDFRDLGAGCLIHDVTESWEELPRADFILFAAGIASPILYRQHPLKTIDITVVGLRHALEHARRNPDFESLVYFSTSEIYGDPDPAWVPTPENYRGNVHAMGPRACYDESKRLGETLCYVYHHYHGLPVKLVRPFNVFGPGLSPDDGRVLPDFLKQILNDEDLVLLSDGTPTRTFCYVEDATVGFLLALLSRAEGEAFNIGSDQEEISMRDLAETFLSVTKPNLSVRRQESEDKHYLTDNPQRRRPDLTKTRAVLGYRPQVSLATGLKRYFDYYSG